MQIHEGWDDEQIEGWKIMLERNVSIDLTRVSDFVLVVVTALQPQKDRILAKHEFSGNTRGPLSISEAPPRGGGDRGGRGGRRGGGRARGGRGRGGGTHDNEGGGSHGGPSAGGDGGSSRGRAWKDRNKASRGNHDRKRGHDKKLARAGGPS